MQTLMNTVRDRAIALDRRLFRICESLQLSDTQHQKAVNRYLAIAKVIDGDATPFSHIESNLYPQGSMRLGATVKPIDGPHDLDFVCEFAIPASTVEPVRLLHDMYTVFAEHGVYGGMVSLKKRCVRVEYKDEFYLDILPACLDHVSGGTCILVPDRELLNWTHSNPIGYADWFEAATQNVQVTQFAERGIWKGAMDRAASITPIPDLEATGEKTVLQLIVQLMKRWRDIHYVRSKFPPISVVLTTLAADLYNGEPLLCVALLNVLDGIVARLDAAHRAGNRLEVCNPSQPKEDFSERWDDAADAYWEFDRGIRRFAASWRDICYGSGNPNNKLEDLFGEVVKVAVIEEGKALQEVRERGGLGINTAGRITPAAAAVTLMRPNTNHGNR